MVAFNPTEVKSVMERLRAAVRESVKSSEQSKFLTTIDALEVNLLTRLREPVKVRSQLQSMRETTRRLLRPVPQAMVRLLKAVDGVEEDVKKFLDQMSDSGPGP